MALIANFLTNPPALDPRSKRRLDRGMKRKSSGKGDFFNLLYIVSPRYKSDMKSTLLAVFSALLLLAGCSDSAPEYPGGSDIGDSGPEYPGTDDIGKTVEISENARAMEKSFGGGPITTDKVNGIDRYYFGGEPYTGWVKFNHSNQSDASFPSIIFHVSKEESASDA